MIQYLPDPLKVFYLTCVGLFKGDDAADAATRRIAGHYPADMNPAYEPRPLPGRVPLGDLDTKRYIPATETELEIDKAVGAGDWRRAASLLDRTWQRWDERSHVAYLLSDAAVQDDAWLREWEQSEPDNPGAMLVRAHRTVRYAWEVRGAKRAKHLTEEQIHGFRRHIELAETQMTRAVAAAPDDPTTYRYMIPIAMGRGWPHEAMDELWGAFTDRHPYGFDGHLVALQYWCAKWRGSHEKARFFAVDAAEKAPKGSFLNVLPLIAAFEEHGLTARKEYRTPQVQAAADACLEELSAFGDTDPRAAYQVRHMLAYILNRLGRHDEAAAQFKAVDGHIGALPWTYFPNRVQEYGWYRRDSMRRTR
jgi:hypothetical protein